MALISTFFSDTQITQTILKKGKKRETCDRRGDDQAVEPVTRAPPSLYLHARNADIC